MTVNNDPKVEWRREEVRVKSPSGKSSKTNYRLVPYIDDHFKGDTDHSIRCLAESTKLNWWTKFTNSFKNFFTGNWGKKEWIQIKDPIQGLNGENTFHYFQVNKTSGESRLNLNSFDEAELKKQVLKFHEAKETFNKILELTFNIHPDMDANEWLDSVTYLTDMDIDSLFEDIKDPFLEEYLDSPEWENAKLLLNNLKDQFVEYKKAGLEHEKSEEKRLEALEVGEKIDQTLFLVQACLTPIYDKFNLFNDENEKFLYQMGLLDELFPKNTARPAETPPTDLIEEERLLKLQEEEQKILTEEEQLLKLQEEEQKIEEEQKAKPQSIITNAKAILLRHLFSNPDIHAYLLAHRDMPMPEVIDKKSLLPDFDREEKIVVGNEKNKREVVVSMEEKVDHLRVFLDAILP